MHGSVLMEEWLLLRCDCDLKKGQTEGAFRPYYWFCCFFPMQSFGAVFSSTSILFSRNIFFAKKFTKRAGFGHLFVASKFWNFAAFDLYLSHFLGTLETVILHNVGIISQVYIRCRTFRFHHTFNNPLTVITSSQLSLRTNFCLSVCLYLVSLFPRKCKIYFSE